MRAFSASRLAMSGVVSLDSAAMPAETGAATLQMALQSGRNAGERETRTAVCVSVLDFDTVYAQGHCPAALQFLRAWRRSLRDWPAL